jgi:hypothetical protein
MSIRSRSGHAEGVWGRRRAAGPRGEERRHPGGIRRWGGARRHAEAQASLFPKCAKKPRAWPRKARPGSRARWRRPSVARARLSCPGLGPAFAGGDLAGSGGACRQIQWARGIYPSVVRRCLPGDAMLQGDGFRDGGAAAFLGAQTQTLGRGGAPARWSGCLVDAQGESEAALPAPVVRRGRKLDTGAMIACRGGEVDGKIQSRSSFRSSSREGSQESRSRIAVRYWIVTVMSALLGLGLAGCVATPPGSADTIEDSDRSAESTASMEATPALPEDSGGSAESTLPVEATPALPDGYVEVRSSGIRVFCRMEDAEFAKTLGESIARRREQADATDRRWEGDVQAVRDSLRFGTPTGSALFEGLVEALGATKAEREKLAEFWESRAELAQVQLGMPTVLDLGRVKLVRAGDLLAGRVPFWRYRANDRVVESSWPVAERAEGVRIVDPWSGREFPITDFWLSAIITRDPLPDGASWQEQLDRCFEVRDSIGTIANRSLASAAFLVLQECVDHSLVTILDTEDAHTRWFRSGMASYLSLGVIRRVLGQEIYSNAPYGETCAVKHAVSRSMVDLLGWARVDSQLARQAHEYYATEELRQLESRHPGILGKLLVALRLQRPVNSVTIFETIRTLCGEDLRARLSKYSGTR